MGRSPSPTGKDDPYFAEDLEAADALAASSDHVELWPYPGEEHGVTDASLAAYDPVTTSLLMERVLAFPDDDRATED